MKKNKIINYHVSDNELLLCSEIEGITASIDELLDNKCTSKMEIKFIEPDFELVLSPKFETGYISMEWKVHLLPAAVKVFKFIIVFILLSLALKT